MNIPVVMCMLGTLLIPVWSNTITTTSSSQKQSDSTQVNQSSSPVPSSSSPVPSSSSKNITASTSVSPIITTLTPQEECAKLNTSCDTCVKNSKCLYCLSDSSCKLYPSGDILPSSDVCALDEARWGVCWLNFEAMIISVSVIGGVIVLTITFCCIYCCCCRNSGSKRQDKEDKKFETNKLDRKVKQTERRAERKSRMDDIRKKYGLMKNDTPYQQFES